MKLTLIQPTDVPAALRPRFGPYHLMFERLFRGYGFEFEAVRLSEGQPLPDPARVEATLVMGSAAGVYDTHYPWMEPLRDYIRRAYAIRSPMLGICFGHQVMADALGGDVRKSEKGWGLGRHVYTVSSHPSHLDKALSELAIACSHQDQVLVPPTSADTFLTSDFTPHAGLVYRNGAALSLQPHPEFDDEYTRALAELRRGKAPDEVIEAALRSIERPGDSREVAGFLAAFLRGVSS